MQQVDTLIVGQGLAGSLLANALIQSSVSCCVIDAGHSNSASRVAAGMFSPVSGQRKTIQPGVLEQIDFAVSTYQQLESLLGVSFCYLRNVIELPADVAEQAILHKRAAAPDLRHLFNLQPSLPSWIQPAIRPIAINHAGWVDCAGLIASFRQWLKQQQLLIESIFDYAALQITPGGFRYSDLQCKQIVFCEGYRASANPFFSDTPLVPCKGDIINIASSAINSKEIVKQAGFYLLPSDEGKARLGATFKWQNADDTLQEADRQVLANAAKAMLAQCEMNVELHQTAIRATTVNRQPVAAAHPQLKGMYQINGLGSKGIILAPWLAQQMMQHILSYER